MTTTEVEPPTISRSETSVVLYLAFLGALMAYGIDASLPAFEQLESEFSLAERGLSPAVSGTAYFVGIAGGQLFWGILADRFGRRPMLAAGITLAAIGAAGSAAAPTLEVLLVSRLLWGLGAAALVLLRFAIARDLFAGDQMARVISTFSAIFLLGPIFVPIFSEAILLVGDWRTIFVVALPLLALAFAWTIQFGETLDPANRRELRLEPVADALKTIVRTRVTIGVLFAQVFATGAFFIWLGSSQPIFDRIYGRDSQFTLFFAASGIAMAVALLAVKPLISKHGARYLVIRAAIGYTLVNTVGLVLALVADGVPSVWLWFGWAVAANICSIVLAPMSISLALEPMADKAGTASALMGVAQFGLGALLAAVFDAQVDLTVTPMIVGTLIYGVAALASLTYALKPHSGFS